MIKSLVAITEEIDEVNQAVAEILGQIDLEKNLLKNSVGLISCYHEFIETGVVRALSQALPFDILGTTTCMTAIPGVATQLGLSLCVLTSDDVEFSTSLTDPITDGSILPFEKGYQKACAELSGAPQLIIAHVPLLMNVGGDMFVDIFDKVSGGIPVFGAISVDHTDDYHLSSVLYNGESFTDRAAYVVISGNISPQYAVVTVSTEKIGYDRSIVTKAQGPQLIEVDNKPVVEYFKSAGFIAKDGTFQNAMNAYPLIVEYEGASEPVLRVAFAMTPDGHAVCGGNIPVGASITIGNIDADEIVASTDRVLSRFIEDHPFTYIQMFACVGRYYCLGLEPDREVQVVDSLTKKAGIPYALTYVGGEMCPHTAKDGMGAYKNINHNDSFILCGF